MMNGQDYIHLIEIRRRKMKKYRIEVKIEGSQVYEIEANNKEEALEYIINNPENYIMIDTMEQKWDKAKIEEE